MLIAGLKQIPHVHALINRPPFDAELVGGELCREPSPKDAPLKEGGSPSVCRGATRSRLVGKPLPQRTGWRMSRLVTIGTKK